MRRWTLRILCWLALGAVVNVGVAWGWAYYDGGQLLAKQSRVGSGLSLAWPLSNYAGKNWPQPSVVHFLTGPGWSGVYSQSEQGSNRPASGWLPDFKMVVQCYGWPARSLRRVQTWDLSGTAEVESCPEGWCPPTDPSGYRFMPSHPLLAGFVVDTLFYSAVPPFLVYGPPAIRRLHRRRKNLCFHCAYPVADPAKPCPECGKGVRA